MQSKGRKIGIAALVLAVIIAAGGYYAWQNYFNPKPAEFTASGESAEVVDHSSFDGFLKKYVKPDDQGLNRLAYGDVADVDAKALDDYVAKLEGVKVSTLQRDEQFAYWVNLYNATTVKVILDNYPVDSIREIGALGLGPWKEKRLTVEGKEVSLDDIEHAILRPGWQDARIHYAVNCASIGCPNLATTAFTSANLEELLEAGAKAYINSPRGFREEDGELVASSIFDWYVVDWGDEEANVLEHAREYAEGSTEELLDKYDVVGKYDYDWNLNE